MTAKKRVHIAQASECSRLVIGGGTWEPLPTGESSKILGPLFAVSARNSVQVFTFVPGVFPCPFSDGLRRSKPQSAAGRNGNVA